MKRICLFIVFSLFYGFLSAQPSTFSWALRHGYSGTSYSYISPAKDQKEPGPCHIFASVAAVEAMSHIYFGKIDADPGLNLSERLLYNNSGVGLYCEASDVVNALNYFVNYGVIDDASYVFPSSPPFCSTDQMTTYNYKVTIPHYTTLSITNNDDLKKAIMDYGPLIVRMPGTYSGTQVGYVLHGESIPHSVLLLGWGESTNSWHLKDSWQGSAEIDYFTVNIFNYSPVFYRVDPIYNNEEIESISGYCEYVIRGSYPVDADGDGFYNWGLDLAARPSGWPGTSKMDFNDSDPTIIFRDGYTPLTAPTLSGPSILCSSGDTYTLNNVPSIMTNNVTWAVTPSNSCSPQSGSGNIAQISPSSYMGRNCKITFTITYGGGTVNYEKIFVINGPRENLVSVTVLDGNGGTPPNYGGTYYLCPNTTYNISYNNSDTQCTTSDFAWTLPYGWSEYWNYNNTIAINTNSYPWGMLEIKAKTSCCSPNTAVTVFSQYFSESNCGDYLVYPNPSDDYVFIDKIKGKMASSELNVDSEYTLSIIDKSGIVKYKTRFKGFPYKLETSSLPKGLYFINLVCNDKKFTFRLSIEH